MKFKWVINIWIIRSILNFFRILFILSEFWGLIYILFQRFEKFLNFNFVCTNEIWFFFLIFIIFFKKIKIQYLFTNDFGLWSFIVTCWKLLVLLIKKSCLIEKCHYKAFSTKKAHFFLKFDIWFFWDYTHNISRQLWESFKTSLTDRI